MAKQANGTATKWAGIGIAILFAILGWSITYGGLLERVDKCETDIVELKPVRRAVGEMQVDIRYIRSAVESMQKQMQKHTEKHKEPE